MTSEKTKGGQSWGQEYEMMHLKKLMYIQVGEGEKGREEVGLEGVVGKPLELRESLNLDIT